jgi:hypothetical protein
MSISQQLHQEAMAIAANAFAAQKAGDNDHYIEMTKSAFEKEKEAAWLLFNKFEAEPTRSVLFRSAAQLAFNCGKIREAERLIAAAMSGNPPYEILQQLRMLNREVQGSIEAVAA